MKEVEKNNEQQERDYDEELRRHRIARMRWLILIPVAIVVIIIVCLARKKTTYSDYTVESSSRRSDSGAAEYIYVGENIYRCSRDGVAAFDGNGNSLWNATYEVGNPYLAQGGEYFAVADLNGNDVYLFNAEGALGSINSAEPIIQVKVSAAGYIAVVVENDGADYIHMYGMEGDHAKIYTIKKSISLDGLPVTIDISPDAQKLVSAYTGVKDGVMNTQLVFSNFDEVGQNENERVVGGYDYADELVGYVEFLNSTVVAVFAEHSLDFYRIKEYPEELSKVEVAEEITYVFTSDSYAGVICKDSETGKSVAKIYNSAGQELLNRQIDADDYSTYRIEGEFLLAYGDERMTVLDFDGKEIYNRVMSDGIVDLFPTGITHEFIYISTNYVQKIRLK